MLLIYLLVCLENEMSPNLNTECMKQNRKSIVSRPLYKFSVGMFVLIIVICVKMGVITKIPTFNKILVAF